MLDLKAPPRRRQGVYWASVMVSIVAHGGFLAYLLAYARLPAQPQPRPRATGVNVKVIGTMPFEALRRGDREMAPPEARVETSVPPTSVEQRRQREASDPANRHAAGYAELAKLVAAPWPEDRAWTDAPQPPAAIAAARTTSMTLPARRMAQIARETRLAKRRAGMHLDDGLSVPDVMPLPPLKSLVVPQQANSAPGGEERRASSMDMGAQGRQVVAELPKEAGIAMFAARTVGDTLPEDRSVAPAPPPRPTRGADVRPAPQKNPGAALAAGRNATTEQRPDGTGNKSPSGFAGARVVRAYRLNIRAHLTAHRPAGGPSGGRAVVAFRLTPQGGVRSVRIVRSSGSASLDQSVLQAVSRAAPFPKPPAGLKPAQLHFLIPFEFR